MNDAADSGSSRERMLAKIRKLMAMGRDARGNEHETEAALRQANKLMQAHGIEEADVDMASLDAGTMIFGEVDVRPDGLTPSEAADKGKLYMRECPGWAGTLAVGVAFFTDTQCIQAQISFGRVLRFRGEKGDVLFAKWLFAVLLAEINAEQAKSGYTTRGDAGAFRQGAASSLHRRLAKMAAERREAFAQASLSGSRALVVVNRKAQEIAERFGEVKYRGGRRVEGSGARWAGQRAGERVNIPAGRPLGSEAAKWRLEGQS